MHFRILKMIATSGLTSLHSNFTWTGSSQSNHSWRQKTEDTGLPESKTASLCVPSVWHNTGVWWMDGYTYRQTNGQTDRRICRTIYSACKASCAEHCKNSNIPLLSI